MQVSNSKKHQVWNHFIERWVLEKLGGGYKVTGSRLNKIKPIIWNDRDFWQDIVYRHGLDRTTPEQLRENDIETYNHCLGNFWGMVYQDLVDRRIISV